MSQKCIALAHFNEQLLSFSGRRVIDHGDVAIVVVEPDEPVLNVKNPKSVGANNRKV